MSQEEPYFLTQEEWWYYDEDEGVYKLKEGAPKEVVDSYNEFYAEAWSDGERVLL